MGELQSYVLARARCCRLSSLTLHQWREKHGAINQIMATKYTRSRDGQQVFKFLHPLPVSCVYVTMTGTGKGTHDLALVSTNLGAVGALL